MSSITVTDEKQSSTSKLAQEVDAKVPVGQAHTNSTEAANDLNAAKVAAMKAAELGMQYLDNSYYSNYRGMFYFTFTYIASWLFWAHSMNCEIRGVD